jgi:hypothetical protein
MPFAVISFMTMMVILRWVVRGTAPLVKGMQ